MNDIEQVLIEYQGIPIEFFYQVNPAGTPNVPIKIWGEEGLRGLTEDWSSKAKEYFFKEIRKYDCLRVEGDLIKNLVAEARNKYPMRTLKEIIC